MHVADILRAKGSTVHTERPDQTIAHLAHRLRWSASAPWS
jgi:hypothetical protein